MKMLAFSNGVTVDSSEIVSVESNQQTIQFPGGIGEVKHLLLGRPSSLVIRLRDGSAVEIKAGRAQLTITEKEIPV